MELTGEQKQAQLKALYDCDEAISNKAVELSNELKCKVTPFAFIHEGENVIGYLREPDRLTKMRAIDLCEQSRTQAGALILISCLIQEHSDRRILEERPENDKIYLGAIDFAVNQVTYYNELLKKK